MHRIGVIGDKDSVLFFKAFGLDVYPVSVEDHDDNRKLVDRLAREGYGIIFITEQIAQTIEEEMFVFDNLVDMDDKNLGALMRTIDNTVLVVALKGVNEEEIPSLVEWAHGEGHDLSLIEVMPLGEVGEEALSLWKATVDLGDMVSVTGRVISSKRGELSVLARSIFTLVLRLPCSMTRRSVPLPPKTPPAGLELERLLCRVASASTLKRFLPKLAPALTLTSKLLAFSLACLP